jgi:hypothetical protein
MDKTNKMFGIAKETLKGKMKAYVTEAPAPTLIASGIGIGMSVPTFLAMNMVDYTFSTQDAEVANERAKISVNVRRF